MRDILTPSTDAAAPNRLRSFLTGQVQKSENARSACNGKAMPVSCRARLHGSVRSEPIARIIVAIAPFVCQIADLDSLRFRARAHRPATRSKSIDRFAKFIEEASDRFAVPARWIRAVMQVESGGDEHAISPRGAMGLMQLMPGTWVELSVRYGLGLDPFDPRDNILAGTALPQGDARSLRIGRLPCGLPRRSVAVMNSTSRQANRFHRKPWPTSRRSRHCSVTSRVNTRHFASDVRSLGGKLRCLLTAPSTVTDHSVCIRSAETSQFIRRLAPGFHAKRLSAELLVRQSCEDLTR